MAATDDLRLLASSATTLDAVDDAMVRLAAGTYGRCDVCGGAIADADLAADPLWRTCGQHRPAAPLRS